MGMSEGGFVWYELMTTDAASAQSFYARVMGWSMADSGLPGPTYTLAKLDEHPVAGIMTIPPHAEGVAPRWSGYILTRDVDGAAERVQAAGGAIHVPPFDIPETGRAAVVADPQGAVFGLFRGNGEAPPDLARDTPGTIGWHELNTTDWEAALAFYQAQFGWETIAAVDLGPMGTYQMFAVQGVGMGGMMNVPDIPAPFWLFYVNALSIDEAASRVAEAGGTVVHGPTEVPGGSWILRCTDPQGAVFALVAPRR